MELGDHVILKKEPLLYGVLRVGVKTADGRYVCEPAHPAVAPHRRRAEIFFEEELEVFTDPLVDVDAAADQLAAREEYEQHLRDRAGSREEADTQAAQDKDADAEDPDDGMGT